MFTGIVEAVGEVVSAVASDDGIRLQLRSPLLAGRQIGASVAVNGVCLTVAEREQDLCTMHVSAETCGRTTLGALREGERVNLERPMRLGDELGGHIVQGHVDGTATVSKVTADEDGTRLRVRVPADLARYVVHKGSITLDGVSLTVSNLWEPDVEVALIPHTLEVTTLGAVRVGHAMNVEVDVLAKYVERLTVPWTTPQASDDDPEISGHQ